MMKKKVDEKLVGIGSRIRTVRKNQKMTLKEMSKKLGIAIGYLSDIENGNANPGPHFFLNLVEQFNTNLDYIFLGQGGMYYPLDKIKSIDTISTEPFHFKGGLNTTEKLVWLMEHSTMLKNNILGYAEQYVLTNEEIVKKSIALHMEAKKEEMAKAATPEKPTAD